jgi:glycosyltransferase involved in cell wall biosynthesis
MEGTVVLIPVLRRPQNVRPLLASLADATPEPHRALFICTRGDRAEIDEIRSAGADLLEIRPFPRGDYARKINAGHQASSETFLFLAADDLRFHPGWLTAALDAMQDPAIGIVGTNDLGNRRVISGEHATHSLVRRSYVDRFGTIDRPGHVLHEGYWHEYVDDEFVETARARGAATDDHAVANHQRAHRRVGGREALPAPSQRDGRTHVAHVVLRGDAPRNVFRPAMLAHRDRGASR